MDVAAWLRGVGLERYEQLFRDNAIDGEVLPDLDDGDLGRLGIPLGHRKRLLRAIAALREPAAADKAGGRGPDPVPAAPASGAAERRQVAVLFADMVGYTRLSAELDAEELHALMGRVFAALDGVIEAYGGTVDKHIGDCVMGVFGAPLAHGDDAERAARAALDIHAAAAQLGASVGRGVAFRLGVASGSVVASGTGEAGARAYTVTGRAVNLAARLTELAEPGATLVSDPVRRSLGHLAEVEPLGAVAVQGFAEPVRAWRLAGLAPRSALAGQVPLVGRRSELAQLRAAVEACRGTGSGGVIHLRGEAGIGKSRLLDELRRHAEEAGFACHVGLVLDFGAGKGRGAVASVVRGLLELPAGADEEGRRAAAERAVATGLAAPDQRVFLHDLLDLAQPPELRALYDAMDATARERGAQQTLAGLLRASAATTPRLVAAEDVHWADGPTLARLANLAAAAAECPALLVLTSRPEGDPLDAAWRAQAGGAPLMTIDLALLREMEAMELAGALLGAVDERARACVERANGNPLFLEQLLRGAGEDAEAAVPDTIQSLVLARVDRLEAADRRALRAASVLGQRFAPAALRHLLGDPGYRCERLVDRHMVRAQDADLLFVHALVHEAVYAVLLTAERRELHRRAADWFSGRDAALRAEHLDRAGDRGAAGAYLEAARAEADAYRYDRALRLAERGLALADGPAGACALALLRGEVLRHQGATDASIAAFREALASAPDDAGRCRAWIGLAAGMRITDDHGRAHEALDRAEAAARAHDLAAELARVHYLRGSLHFPRGDLEGCLREHGLALGHARRARLPEVEAQALSGLGDAEYGRGRMVSAHGYFRRCVALAREHGLGRIEVANLGAAGLTRLYLGDPRGAADDLLAAAGATVEVGNRRAELVHRLDAALALWELGEADRARDQVDQAMALVRALGARRFEAEGLLLEARLLHDEGRRPEALGSLERAAASSRETGIAYLGAAIAGEIAAVTDTADAREAALAEGEALLAAGAVSHNHLWFRRRAMDATLRAGDWGAVERHAAALDEYTCSERLPWADFFVARGRALAAQGRSLRGTTPTTSELAGLRDDARRMGFRSALPLLEAALASA